MLQTVATGPDWALYAWAPNTQRGTTMMFAPTDVSAQERQTNAGFAAMREVDTTPVRPNDIRRLMSERPKPGTDNFWRRPPRLTITPEVVARRTVAQPVPIDQVVAAWKARQGK